MKGAVLEQCVPDRSCSGCCERRRCSVLVVADRLANGSVVLQDREPETCSQCGTEAELVVKVIRPVVGVSDRNDEVKHGKGRP
jgi:hypothetical protein